MDHIDLLITELSNGQQTSQEQAPQQTTNRNTFDIPDLPGSDFHEEINQVLSGMMKDSPGPKNPIEEMSAFLSAIDFKEDGNWIYPLLFVHLFMFLGILKFRKRVEVLAAFFVVFAIPLRLSDMINDYLSPIHALFSSQNYFTKDGIFLTCFFSLPLLLNCCLIVFFLVMEAGKLLVVVKRLEIEEKGKKISKENRKKKGDKKKD